MLAYRIVPESIRWLVSKQEYLEARKLILKAAKVNGKMVPDELLVVPLNRIGQELEVKALNLLNYICKYF